MMTREVRRRLIMEAAHDRAKREFWKMICWVSAGFVGAFLLWILWSIET